MARPRTFIIDQETLYDLYIVQNLKGADIAKSYGVCWGAVQKRLTEYGIKKGPKLALAVNGRKSFVAPARKFKLTPEELRYQYIDLNKTDREIGREIGVCNITVATYRAKYGISRSAPLIYNPLPEAEVRRMYVDEKKTMEEMAIHFECGESTVRQNILRYGLALDSKEVAERRLERNRIRYTQSYVNQGYVSISKPDHPAANRDGYIKEHRYVAEQVIGRHLHPEEEVHHINMVKIDNRIQNLAVIDTADHARLHKYLERIAVFVVIGGPNPGTLTFKKPVFWAGHWINWLDLSKNLKPSFVESFKAAIDAIPTKETAFIQ